MAYDYALLCEEGGFMLTSIIKKGNKKKRYLNYKGCVSDLVYVVNKDGKALMPCTNQRARMLLKEGKAKVIGRENFTIKLLHGSSGYKQDVVGGMDPGSRKVGSAAVANGKTVYLSELTVRNDVHSKMEQRAMYRRNRRGRKIRYRKPRFNNRKRPEGWLTPTLKSKVDSHLREMKYMESILPISHWKVEMAAFDIHAITNPEVFGADYQNGDKKSFYNTKAYVLHRDGHTCQHCKGKEKCNQLHVHHKIFRSNGGTDSPDNLVCLCKVCHDKLHTGKIELRQTKKSYSKTKHATEVSIICAVLLKSGWEFEQTYGYETKLKRELCLKLPKEHFFDAVAICAEIGEIIEPSNVVLYKKNVSKGDYQLRKGSRSETIIPVHKLFGMRKFDFISTEKGCGFISGKRSRGYFSLKDIFGNKISDSVNIKRNCIRISARKTTLIKKITYRWITKENNDKFL